MNFSVHYLFYYFKFECLSTVNSDFLFNPTGELLFLIMNLNCMNESALEASKRDASLCALFFKLAGRDLSCVSFVLTSSTITCSPLISLFLAFIEKPQL